MTEKTIYTATDAKTFKEKSIVKKDAERLAKILKQNLTRRREKQGQEAN